MARFPHSEAFTRNPPIIYGFAAASLGTERPVAVSVEQGYSDVLICQTLLSASDILGTPKSVNGA